MSKKEWYLWGLMKLVMNSVYSEIFGKDFEVE